MRSIGKKNRAIVEETTRRLLKARTSIFNETNYQGIDESVIDELPEEMFETWEMAYQEIKGIINDVCSDWTER